MGGKPVCLQCLKPPKVNFENLKYTKFNANPHSWSNSLITWFNSSISDHLSEIFCMHTSVDQAFLYQKSVLSIYQSIYISTYVSSLESCALSGAGMFVIMLDMKMASLIRLLYLSINMYICLYMYLSI
jgi:hypothetical protein